MSALSRNWPVKKYEPRYDSWPYKASDFDRQDPSSDSSFYSSPRFVTHIDDAAIASLRAYYDTVLPRQGKILDFCSSWVSHYPPSIESAATSSPSTVKITGLGMSVPELEANPILNHGRIVHDLNRDPNIHAALLRARAISSEDDESEKYDAATNVVSTDYLTDPVAVLKSLREAMKPGGRVHLTISNRCFPTKAIARWLRVSEQERLAMVGDFLHFAGWSDIEIIEISNGQDEKSAKEQSTKAGGLMGLMSWMGMHSRDPLWVVRTVKR